MIYKAPTSIKNQGALGLMKLVITASTKNKQLTGWQ